jgi:hypothetical protein
LVVAAMEDKKRFDDLNDDCVLLIIRHIRQLGYVNHPMWWDPAVPTLKAFSCVNRKYRQLCLPTLFNLRDLAIRGTGTKTQQSPFYDALSKSAFAADCVR